MRELEPWKILRSQLVFNHPWYKVRQDQVQLPNGTIVDDFFLSVRPDVALVLPVTVAQDIVCVQQYRHGAGEVLLELPAGTFDPQQEQPEAAALRELQQETGYSTEHLIKLATLHDNPVKDTNKIHLFLAEQVQQVEQQNLDITEEIEIVLIPLSQITDRILQGDLRVSGTIAAVFLGLNYLKNKHSV